jgi:hypothetical protein
VASESPYSFVPLFMLSLGQPPISFPASFLLAFGQLSADGMLSRGAVGMPGEGPVLSLAVDMKASSSCCHCVC